MNAVASGDWPWLSDVRDRWQVALRSGRLPHAVLLLGPRGIGKRRAADWITAASLCERNGSEPPCGRCASCALLAAGTHPDLKFCTPEEDSTSIKIEQIRGLGESLSMKSYRGGRKVAVIDPADSMTHGAFNALLKTLEEPAPETILLLTVARPERLPVTIASRCQRLPILAPDREQGLAWLNRQMPRDDWPLLLDLAAGVPPRALDLAANGGDALYVEVEQILRDGGPDVPARGESWAKDRPEQRLRCLEHCLSTIARRAFAGEAVNNSRRGSSPTSGRLPDLGGVVRLLDLVRETRSRLDGPANPQMLFETLLIRLRQVFG